MSKQRAKGTSFETALVNWLRARGHDAHRLPLSGNKDKGDIEIRGAGFNLEAKNCRTYTLPAWVAEAEVETLNAGRPVVVVAKRNGKADPGASFVIQSLEAWARSALHATMALEERSPPHDVAL